MRLTEHPSNRLYRGEARDFPEAARLYDQAIDYEQRNDFRAFPGDAVGDAETQQFRTLLAEDRAIMRAALGAYAAAAAELRGLLADRVAAALTAQYGDRDELIDLIVTAIRENDYTTLAI